MVVVNETQRFRSHANAFGFLRLLFASLVIVSHTPELVDGDRRREILSRLFGTLSFGDFSVDGFFIISGFLITGSYIASQSLRTYLIKRIARIYPAFTVASLLSVLVVGPLSGAALDVSLKLVASTIAKALLLYPAYLPDSFVGSYYPLLNNPMWTIRYEFFCYLLVIPLGSAGLLRRPAFLAAIALGFLALQQLIPTVGSEWAQHLPKRIGSLIGEPASLARFAGLFVAGSALYGLQYRLPILSPKCGWWAVAAAIGLVLCLCIAPLAHIGLASFGAYLILAAAAWGGGTWLHDVNDKDDISYGIYLYAWPIEKLLIWYGFVQSLVALGCVTWIGAAFCGWISWVGLERPIMKRVRPARRPAQPAAAA